MTTARTIITNALTLRLSVLAVGETLQADTAELCRAALNELVDAANGDGNVLWRTLMVESAAGITGASGTLGTTWATVPLGTLILGATYSDGGADNPMQPLTMAQYHERVYSKTASGAPAFYAHDGGATVYFYPAASGQKVKLRVREQVQAFADLDTDYSMPAGYGAFFSDCLAERVGPTLVREVPADVRRAAAAGRTAMKMRALKPGILGGGPVQTGMAGFLNGW